MSKTSPEEEPKRKVAKRVITPKRKYFVPERGGVEATDLEDLTKQLNKLDEQEDGDGNS